MQKAKLKARIQSENFADQTQNGSIPTLVARQVVVTYNLDTLRNLFPSEYS